MLYLPQLWGVATLGRVAGEIRVNGMVEDGVNTDMNKNSTLKCQLGWDSKIRRDSV